MVDTNTAGYAHPEALVSTDWVASKLNDPSVRIIESNEDQLLFKSGHIAGAVEIDWVTDLNHPLRRDYLDGEHFAALMSRVGVTRDTCVVLYGDKHNWWACYTFWVFKLFGHRDVRIMDGGRLKWTLEGKPLTTSSSSYPPSAYPTVTRDDEENRTFRDAVLLHMKEAKPLVDVRSPEEFSGEKLHMEGYPQEGALRGGHIPGAKSVPWARAVAIVDGTFKPIAELRALYLEGQGLKPHAEIITYCRIGERSSHTWFVLKYLLGFSQVKNYDGSWTEWGNLVGVPIEKSVQS